MEKLKRKRMWVNDKRDAIAGYLFILPFIFGFLFLFLTPLINSLIYSFSLVKVDGTEFVGFANYNKAFFEGTDFNRRFVGSMRDIAIQTPGVFLVSFIIACVINAKFKGRTLVRAILFLPVILSSGTVLANQGSALTDTVQQKVLDNMYMFNNVSGYIRNAIPVPNSIIQFLMMIIGRIVSIVRMSGVQILIFLSALQTIPHALYEASTMEGATAWENFWKITIPLASPYILVCWVFTVIALSASDGDHTLMFISFTSLNTHDYGYGSAMGWVYLTFVLGLLGLSSFLISKLVFYYDKT